MHWLRWRQTVGICMAIGAYVSGWRISEALLKRFQLDLTWPPAAAMCRFGFPTARSDLIAGRCGKRRRVVSIGSDHHDHLLWAVNLRMIGKVKSTKMDQHAVVEALLGVAGKRVLWGASD